jgi:minor extracellular serine protease Vpr
MKPRRIWIAALSLVLAPVALAAVEGVFELDLVDLDPIDTTPGPEQAAPPPAAYFVELKKRPSIEGTAVEELRAEKDALRGTLRAKGISFRERFAFEVVYNGLSVELTEADASAVSALPEVKAVHPVGSLSSPDAVVPAAVYEGTLVNAMEMVHAGAAWDAGLTGRGVRVGVVDSGLDYRHPDLGGLGLGEDHSGPGPDGTVVPWGRNPRIVAGWDFADDDADPFDCHGHGTLVTGNLAASGPGARGIAPEVDLGIYRVGQGPCTGNNFGTTADLVLAAVERAYLDGMDVINLSLGGPYYWGEEAVIQGLTRIVNHGVVVVAGAGNLATAFSTGSPANAEKVLAVASFDNAEGETMRARVHPGGRVLTALLVSDPRPVRGSTTPPLVDQGNGCPTTVITAAVSGKVALMDNGAVGCSVPLRYQAAADKGAVLTVFARPFDTYSWSAPALFSRGIPSVQIFKSDGDHLRALLAAGEQPTLTWLDEPTGRVAVTTGGLVSTFSSAGPTPDLLFKPELGAPGLYVRGVFPLHKGGYATWGGTSSATPIVAGAAALLLEARPNLPVAAVRSLLMGTARPARFSGNLGAGQVEQVHRQGAGVIDVEAALAASARVEPAALALGESEHGPVTRTLTVTNDAAAAVTFDVRHEPAVARGPTGAALVAPASVVAPAELTVAPGGSATLTVSIAPHAGLAPLSLYGGYLVLAPREGGGVLRVPYGGVAGDYQTLVAMGPGTAGFPWLARRVATSAGSPLTDFTRLASGGSFTFAGGDVPHLLVHLDHGARRLRIEAIDAGGAARRILEEEFLTRHASGGVFTDYAWDGNLHRGNKTAPAAAGTYVLRVSALKALGDEANPAHWEIWHSAPVTVIR